jgi:ribulose-phosphate 3-epimerase
MSRSQPLKQLRAAAPAVLPSMLLCDFGNLEREVERLLAAGVPGFHLDVMDGSFVPNLTYGMPIVQAFRRLTGLPLDVHLMIQRPENYIDKFRDAGADVISFHIEATHAPQPLLKAIRSAGAAAGIAINPATPLSAIDDCLDQCDLVLVMSVQAGFGGQAFNPVALERLQQLRERLGDDITLEVDGGVSRTTIAQCAAAGADLFVVGSAIFNTDDYGTAITQLRELAQAPGATGFH